MQLQEFKKRLKVNLDGADGIKNVLQNNQNLPHEIFVSKVIGTVMSSPDLQKCEFASIIQSCIKSAQLGLPVDVSGYAYLVPFKGKCTFQIGAKGYIELCKRNKNVLQITHNSVYKNDEFDYWQNEGGFHYKHKIALNEQYNREGREGLVCVYATIKYTNGGTETQLMDIQSIEKIKGSAQTTYIWDKWYTEKAITAVIKRLLKRQCLMNIQEALQKDDDNNEDKKTIKNIDEKVDTVDNTPITENEAKELQTLIDKTNQSAMDICELYNINVLQELPKSDFEILKKSLQSEIQEKQSTLTI